jgi:WD40 repeat protein
MRTAGATAPVTALLALGSDTDGGDARVAAGYDDGTIRVWSLTTHKCVLTLRGHRSGVTCLCANADQSLLASGGKDTDVIVWDPVGEQGLYRLRGHTNAVTAVAFAAGSGGGAHTHVVSASKDALVKVGVVAAFVFLCFLFCLVSFVSFQPRSKLLASSPFHVSLTTLSYFSLSVLHFTCRCGSWKHSIACTL